jgi:WD40 repeat protein
MDGGMIIGGNMKALILAILFLLIAPHPATAREPREERILRIEASMHTEAIVRIGVDREERYLVTGSLDKTVRVWDLQTGRLLRTLRPPVGEGNEGRIYAVAISPDGKTIACGGWTGFEWDEREKVPATFQGATA